MMIAALGALAAGAIAGVFLATRHFLRKRLPVWGALLHGVGGAIGFLLVLLTVVAEPTFRPIRSVLYLLIATIALGCVNLLFHVRRVRHRTSLILMHGLCAVSGATWLVYAIVAHQGVQSATAAQSEPNAPAPVPLSQPGPSSAARPELAKAAPAPPSPTPPVAHGPDKVAVFAVDPAVQRVLGRSVYFETNRADLRPDAKALLAEVAGILVAHPEIAVVEVQGHADERGDDAHNIPLTQERAGLVVDVLVAGGVARERLHVAGYGARCSSDPACRRGATSVGCHASSQWDKDRRVAFQVLRVGSAAFRGEVACERAADLIPEEDRAPQAP